MLGANDTLIKNGLIYDPTSNSFSKRDLAICGRRIAELRELSPSHRMVDASNCIVTRGLIDAHAHVAQGCSDTGVAPDIFSLPNGVTTVVDAGTTGCANFESFYRGEIVHSTVDVRACLHVSPAGMTTLVHIEEGDPQYYQSGALGALIEAYPSMIVGLKTRASKNYISSGDALRAAIELSDALGRPLVVHANDPVVPAAQLALMLRSGDVFCHMYHGSGSTILGGDGHVLPECFEAKSRGVLFDACHGYGNFDLKIASAAIREGFLPDIISTDTTVYTCYAFPVYSLAHIMSKFRCLGMDWNDIFRAVTMGPASFLGEPEKISLAPGSPADLAVFRIVAKNVDFGDAFGGLIHGRELLIPQMTIKDGSVVYRQTDF